MRGSTVTTRGSLTLVRRDLATPRGSSATASTAGSTCTPRFTRPVRIFSSLSAAGGQALDLQLQVACSSCPPADYGASAPARARATHS